MSSLSLVQIHGLVAKVPSSSFFGLPIPYVPVNNEGLVEAAKKATIMTDASVGPSPIQPVPKEILGVIFSYITNYEDFKSVSEVCRVFYRVSKFEALWKNHLCSLLPDVCPLTSGTSFTIEKQFKIAFEAHKSAIKKLMEADKYSNVLRQRCSINLIAKADRFLDMKSYGLWRRLNRINDQENFEKMIMHVEHYDKFANSLLYARVSPILGDLNRLRVEIRWNINNCFHKLMGPFRNATPVIQAPIVGLMGALIAHALKMATEWCQGIELPESIAIGRALFNN